MKPTLNIAIYAIGLISSKLVALALQPFVTQWLGPEQFGRLDVLITLGIFLSLFLALGLTDAIYRFAHENKHQQEIFSGALWLIILFGGTLTLLAQIAAPTIQQYLPGKPPLIALRCLLLTLFINTLCTVPFAILRIRDQARQFVIAQVLFALIQGGAIVLLAPKYGISGIMIAGLVAQTLQLLILYKVFPTPKPRHQQLILRYGMAITVSGVLGFITLGAERWAIAHSLSLTELAPYAIAIQWAMAASLLLEPFALWWFPKRFSLTSTKEDRQKAANLSIVGCQISCLITAGVITIGPRFLTVWLPQDFHASADIIPFLGIMLMFKHASTLLNMGCYQQRNGQSVMLIGLISCIISLIILFFILPNLGLYALLWSGIVLQVLRVILFFFWSQRRLSLPYPLPRLGLSYALIALLLLTHVREMLIYELIISLILTIQITWPWLGNKQVRKLIKV
ncbi:lipopolysaccharide biosynthesis protein [uncultured Photobacterium sp.]|uniref:lipopolysaccharide biosynthesis protein n=1 Tax=uncultured Photobacterium sp. TaxID=173973 RepID=UPI00261B97D9|nr:oligosaccharide flippase family protein [uncultured Photobacterium sp.]